MSNLVSHARFELEKAGFFDKEKDFYGGMTGKAVIELIELFAKQGHSGMSAPIVISLFSELANFKPLGAITGDDDEWNEVGREMFQNKRLSSVLKEGKNGRAYYLDAIIWKDETGSFSGTVAGIKSSQFISFPFIPKTFYVKVDSNRNIVDSEELKKALAHYK
jgi:hypothetical protein